MVTEPTGRFCTFCSNGTIVRLSSSTCGAAYEEPDLFEACPTVSYGTVEAEVFACSSCGYQYDSASLPPITYGADQIAIPQVLVAAM